MRKEKKMKLIIHDLSKEEYSKLPIFPEDSIVISNGSDIKRCIGCFGCWFKTPGRCVLKDGYEHMGEYLGKADELIVISRCSFGSYSPFVKTVFDRSISYILPLFEKIEGEMHHKPRYKNNLKITTIFYGDQITNEEKETAKTLVKRNTLNLHASLERLIFLESKDRIKEALV